MLIRLYWYQVKQGLIGSADERVCGCFTVCISRRYRRDRSVFSAALMLAALPPPSLVMTGASLAVNATMPELSSEESENAI